MSAADRSSTIASHLSTPATVFAHVPMSPPDPILNLAAKFAKDQSPDKVNLGVGAYRDENGRPWVLPAVRQADEQLLNDPSVNHEYLPIKGLATFNAAAAQLMFGDSAALKEGRIVSHQTLSGTGANHLGAKFIERFYQFPTESKTIYVCDPTWPNHFAIMGEAGLTVQKYPYYDSKTLSLDIDGLLRGVNEAPNGSVFLLHACAHNPSGVDPTPEQWRQIADAFRAKHHFAFFDSAYQGFVSGDPDHDALAVRLFESSGIPMLVCQSFAKNAGLYGERAGALHVITANTHEAAAVSSQLDRITRSEFSMPPAYGVRLVERILTQPALRAEWDANIKTMSGRIIEMRESLFDLLTNKYKTPGSWEHIVSQKGMFSFLGINPEQCQRMEDEGHIYLVKTGRISMAGLNPGNIDHVAKWIDRVVRNA
ncbi:aspartate transaminase [Malassezia cuniculi]|uniref:Aspartate aminotransferase n=1 Tax=Malassezia cuniculi TaxID=948313 RepID=A0AAF0EVN7_9BASI|nr:aspartate transaminase [Malassezia cuniculi]